MLKNPHSTQNPRLGFERNPPFNSYGGKSQKKSGDKKSGTDGMFYRFAVRLSGMGPESLYFSPTRFFPSIMTLLKIRFIRV